MQAFAQPIFRFLRKRRFLAIWFCGALAVAATIVLAFSPLSPLDRLNALVFDAYQNLQPRPAAESPVVVVDIDDDSIRKFGQWPWPRSFLAGMIDRLGGMGAASIGLDILFSEPDRTSPALALAQLRDQGFQIVAPATNPSLDNDQVFAESFARSPVVSGLALADSVRTPPPDPKAGFSYGGTDPLEYLGAYQGSVRNLAPLDEAATGVGVISFPPGRDGIVREIPLISRYDNKLYPALSLELLRVAQGASTYVIRSTGAHGEQDTGSPGMVAVKDGDYEVPTGPEGKMWVYYARRPAAPVVPVLRLMSPEPDPAVVDMVAGRIVLIGTSAIGLRDLVSTPLASGLPGVLVHAEIIDQIVGGTFLSRPDWAVGAEVVAAVVLALLVLALLPWLPSFFNALVAAGAVTVGIAGGWLGFDWYKLLLSPILPVQCTLIAYGVGSGVRLLLSESERRYIRSAFSLYLAPSMVQRLVDNPQSLNLGGENRELTMLFCDIRGFTSLSEGLGPQELTVLLNNFLTPMTDVLMGNGATIDKYMGDAIMAFWNAPLPSADHQRRACRSVLQMQETLAALNRDLPRPISIGIGLNTGICCVGNLGIAAALRLFGDRRPGQRRLAGRGHDQAVRLDQSDLAKHGRRRCRPGADRDRQGAAGRPWRRNVDLHGARRQQLRRGGRVPRAEACPRPVPATLSQLRAGQGGRKPRRAGKHLPAGAQEDLFAVPRQAGKARHEPAAAGLDRRLRGREEIGRREPEAEVRDLNWTPGPKLSVNLAAQ